MLLYPIGNTKGKKATISFSPVGKKEIVGTHHTRDEGRNIPILQK
ncbi:hypothetical protein [Tengunoibacter tsumagoiensis]|nr:hypothetical protein [Tengunoibacter tsumagoiensis]